MENKDYKSNLNTQDQSADSNDIKKIVNLCLRKWYWFVFSVFCCVAVAAFYVIKQTPQYSRTATVLIKESNTRRTSASDIEAMLAQAGTISSKVANEVVVFQAPILMEESVRRLGLTTEYGIHGRVRNAIVYGSAVPATVDFVDVPDEVYMTFDITPNADDSTFVMSNLRYVIQGDKFKVKTPLAGQFGDTLATAVGTLVINRNPYYFSETPWTRPEYVVKRSLANATRKFSSELTVSSDAAKKMSDVITLTMVDASPRRADELINMLISVYNENWVQDMNQMAVSTSIFIKDRLNTIENELAKVDDNISDYKSKNLLPSIDAASQMFLQQTTDITTHIRELENELSVSKFLRNYMATTITSSDLIPVPSGIKNTGIINQISEYNRQLLVRQNLVANSSEKNPLVMDLDNQLLAMRTAIMSSVNNQVETLEEQIRYEKTQESKATSNLAQNPSQAKDLLVYERLQKVQESLYLFLLQKREENELSQAFAAYNTRIINPPYGSSKPVSPKKSQILLIAFLLGLCIPVAIIYIAQVSDTKVRCRDDLDTMLAPFLGEIPMNFKVEDESAKVRFKKRVQEFFKKDDGERKEDHAMVVEAGNRDIINEAFRVLRTNLEFVSKSDEGKVFMLTSFNPGSGKTFISINLATALAIKGKKVVVIDGDFRRASFSRFFGLRKNGLADYLADPSGKSYTQYIVQHDKIKTLYILPVGTIPPNPSELVSDVNFQNVIADIKTRFDYVFIDCAPVDIVADTQIIAPVADRTVFVVRAGLFEKKLIRPLNEMYSEGKYNNISVVLNGTEFADSYYHSRYSYKYSYGKGGYGRRYGYAYGKGRGRYGYYNYSSTNED